ncbi:uncharacterized protein L969DRAFT_105086 [Mixia osmundae IAM 14324]|uniref:Ribose-5-phosphate isomerase n=1 Tax=Mixia osmundae (strain CBS 9802 / IAM 14324 / JCM 22182 / KY 12970) TaxID=764103 RepID=G7DWE7_MIXOS|nr:uncharacterized protein L969DRAFT_105086 [Mixia osmundae IAM 14324]KEI37280.1 hypothetical protein L969DRAFT_105086 [Mixia osmundae IAM 14324]GAA94907.1 hypothetical protein E5Q_01562 [Mixia osmundae IAM 14324]
MVNQDAKGKLKKLEPVEAAKRLAAYAAVDAHIKPHHRVIGIGSGSTVPYVVERILEQGSEINEDRWFIPTGFQSKQLIVQAGLNLGDVDQFPSIDVTIDGADEVDDDLNAIKGGGACHLREKVLAEAAADFILVADSRKDSRVLGTTWTQGIPVEVAPFAWAKVYQNLALLGCEEPILRMGKAKAGPIVTDNGNFVIDAPFSAVYMRDPADLLHRIKMLTGVLEVGLFAGMAKAAYFGQNDGSVIVRYVDASPPNSARGPPSPSLAVLQSFSFTFQNGPPEHRARIMPSTSLFSQRSVMSMFTESHIRSIKSLDDLDNAPGGRSAKPKYPYVITLRAALLGSPNGQLTLQEIYAEIANRFPYYKHAGKGWKNSVRHNLSINRCFKRIKSADPSKGSLWSVDEDEEVTTTRIRNKKRYATSSRSNYRYRARAAKSRRSFADDDEDEEEEDDRSSVSESASAAFIARSPIRTRRAVLAVDTQTKSSASSHPSATMPSSPTTSELSDANSVNSTFSPLSPAHKPIQHIQREPAPIDSFGRAGTRPTPITALNAGQSVAPRASESPRSAAFPHTESHMRSFAGHVQSPSYRFSAVQGHQMDDHYPTVWPSLGTYTPRQTTFAGAASSTVAGTGPSYPDARHSLGNYALKSDNNHEHVPSTSGAENAQPYYDYPPETEETPTSSYYRDYATVTQSDPHWWQQVYQHSSAAQQHSPTQATHPAPPPYYHHQVHQPPVTMSPLHAGHPLSSGYGTWYPAPNLPPIGHAPNGDVTSPHYPTLLPISQQKRMLQAAQ